MKRASSPGREELSTAHQGGHAVDDPKTRRQHRDRAHGLFTRSDHVLAIITPGGESAIMEIEPPGGTAQRAGRRVVYLDQGHWGSLARRVSDPGSVTQEESAAADKLIGWARDRRIVLPLSSGHVVETTPLYAAKRQRLALTMLQLSCGWHMRNPVLVVREAVTHILTSAEPVP